MAYRIPQEKEVVKAIENVLVRNPHIRSQAELYRLVSTELLCMDEEYRIGEKRIRTIGIANGLFNLEISYARTDNVNERDLCPVCGGKLESVRNRTLYWDTVELMRTCSRCGYAAKSDASRPARYHISRRMHRCPMTGLDL